MRILLDVDGVICDFVSAYCANVARVTGRVYTLADVTDYDFSSFGLSQEERGHVESLLMDAGWVRSLGEIAGSRRGLAALAAGAVELVFVTSPWKGHPTWAHEREAWLEERWPGVPIVSTRHKHFVSGDVLVDDKADQVAAWQKEHPKGCGLLWDAPYNARVTSLTRVRGWHDVIREVFGPKLDLQAVGL